MQKCPLFWSKLDIFPVFCEILQNPPLFEKIPQFPILKNLSPLLGQKSHKTGKFPPFGHTALFLFLEFRVIYLSLSIKKSRNFQQKPLWWSKRPSAKIKTRVENVNKPATQFIRQNLFLFKNLLNVICNYLQITYCEEINIFCNILIY